MGTESIEASFLSIFALISFFVFLIISKFSFKIGEGVLLDKDFNKPQAFHDLPVTRSGGLAIIISLSIFFGIYYLLYSKILFDYILICYSMFLVGFLDDLKIKIKPFRRLLMMIFLLFVLFNPIFFYCKFVKQIGITSANSYGAKRTRTADPLHAMQVLYQLSYGPKYRNVSDINLS